MIEIRATLTALALCCAVLTGAEAQTTTPDTTAATPDTAAPQIPAPTPATAVTVIDDAALARSARASKLIGSDLYSAGESVGKIDDLLVDREHATVTGVIVAVGGLLGIGEKRIAIPITAIKLGNEAKFTLDMSKDDLKNAAVFDYAKLK
jgi:sporulation protein YlmC with PRC-barrel domain